MYHIEDYDNLYSKKKNKKKRLSNKFNKEFIINDSNDYAIVIESKYNKVFVLYKNEIIDTKLKENTREINNKLLFPGDKVELEKIKDKYIISHLIKRKSLLSRIKKDSSRANDLGTDKYVAANVNLAIIVVSAKEPPLHSRFIDRYMMILQDNNIDTVICLNKCELKTNEDDILNVYRDLGIKVIETSTKKNIGINNLIDIIEGKNAILLGNSGVGKSSLINSLIKNNIAKTSSIGIKTNRGVHTTTSSKYYIIDDNTSIIDTPGIRSLDVSSFSISDIQNYFTEFNKYKTNCKYKDCLHNSEPIDSCGIKQALKDGYISKERYDSYIKIINEKVGGK